MNVKFKRLWRVTSVPPITAIGAAMGKVFLPDGKVEISYGHAGTLERLGELVGREAIGVAVATMMRPHSPRGQPQEYDCAEVFSNLAIIGIIDARTLNSLAKIGLARQSHCNDFAQAATPQAISPEASFATAGSDAFIAGLWVLREAWMIVLDHQPHAWFLLDLEGQIYLDVHCSHSAFDYSVLIAMNEDELKQYRSKGRAYLDKLAEDIHYSAPGARGSASIYRTRDVTSELGDLVTAAIAEWRTR